MTFLSGTKAKNMVPLWFFREMYDDEIITTENERRSPLFDYFTERIQQ
jgi:hypothetical protein